MKRKENAAGRDQEKLNMPDNIRPKLKVQLAGTESFFGPGVRTLLAGIRREGSVREACEKMGMSYSKGRRIIERAERELGFSLIERSHGGKNGGGAMLSEKGALLLECYGQFEQELEQIAEEKYRKIFVDF
jgi:molybdate transport repressor ModE-like protein